MPCRTPGTPPSKPRRVIAQSSAPASSFHPDQAELFVREELVERANRVGSTAHTGNDRAGQTPFLLQYLPLQFLA